MAPRAYRNLDDVFADDDGLLDTAPANPAPGRDQRLVQAFEAISAFVDQHGREPSPEATGDEKTLARRLAGLRKRTGAERATLVAHDRHDLIGTHAGTVASQAAQDDSVTDPADPAEEVTSLDDILADDDGLLDTESPELYEARHVTFDADTKRETPEEVAQREPCEDFWRFETLFRDIRREIDDGRSHTERFQKNAQIDVGDFFVLDGVLCVVDDIVEADQSAHGRFNPRLRVVFDNATEANLLLRSLERALQKDPHGRRVLLDPDRALERMQGITHHDHRRGTIYILRSKRDDAALAEMGDLHKIGYTEESVEKRIAHAERDPTYLEAPVEVVATFTCYNADPRTIERVIHAILMPLKVNVILRDCDGRRYRPREWFAVPLSTAKAVVEHIADGTIKQYRLDPVTATLVEKNRKYRTE